MYAAPGMLSFSSLPHESKSNLKKGKSCCNMVIKYLITGHEVIMTYLRFQYTKPIETHSVLNRLLMELIQGGNGNVDSLFISFSLSSDCETKRKKNITRWNAENLQSLPPQYLSSRLRKTPAVSNTHRWEQILLRIEIRVCKKEET